MDDARFEKAVAFVLSHEGGFSHHPNDPGGATNFGVSLRYLKEEGIDVDMDGDIDIDDIRALDEEMAKKIYKERWWDKGRYNEINELSLAAKILDMAVNMGAKQAHKIVQCTSNEISKKALRIDGILGAISRDRLNALTRENRTNLLIEKLKFNCGQFYRRLVSENPSLKVFLRGWLNRSDASL